jgi:hypothetical protein
VIKYRLVIAELKLLNCLTQDIRNRGALKGLKAFKEDFDKILLEAVDEALAVLGSGKDTVFFHLQRTYSLVKEEIPRRPEDFAKALENMFGAGAKVLETLIVKCLYSKLGLKYDEKSARSFMDYIKSARKAKPALKTENEHGDSSSIQIREEEKGIQISHLPYTRTGAFETKDFTNMLENLCLL